VPGHVKGINTYVTPVLDSQKNDKTDPWEPNKEIFDQIRPPGFDLSFPQFGTTFLKRSGRADPAAETPPEKQGCDKLETEHEETTVDNPFHGAGDYHIRGKIIIGDWKKGQADAKKNLPDGLTLAHYASPL
jgi:hypothetical protein